MHVHFLPPSALIAQVEQARTAGKKDVRAVYAAEPIAALFQQIIDDMKLKWEARSELRHVTTALPVLTPNASTEAFQRTLAEWIAQEPPASAGTPEIPGADLTGIYPSSRELAADLHLSEVDAFIILVRALVNPSLVPTEIRTKILDTAKTSLGDMAFLLDGLSERPVHLEGVIGDKALAKNGAPLAELLAILELASQGKVSVSYAVTDTDGLNGVNVGPFQELLQKTFTRFQLGPDIAAQNVHFLPSADSSPKAVTRLLMQQMQDPRLKNSAKGLLHEAVDFLDHFGYHHDVARILQGDVNYAVALIFTAGLLRKQIGEDESLDSIWELKKKMQRYGGVEAMTQRVEKMLANVHLVLQAA